jgi:hypothetical protein
VRLVQYVEPGGKSDSELEGLTWTEEEETAIRHKIDWHVVPLVTVLYMFCVSILFFRALDASQKRVAFYYGHV